MSRNLCAAVYPSGKLDLVLGTKRQRLDSRGNQTSWHFDRGGRLVEKRAPGYVSGPAHRWLYQYDPEGRLTQGQDGNQAIVAVERDNLRRPVSRYAFPGNWPLSLMTTLESFGYDDLGRLGSATTCFASWNPLQNAHLVTVGMERDASGKILSESFRFMAMSLGTEKVLASGYTAGQQVDGSFRRSLDYPSGFEVAFTPDGAGKLACMEVEPPTGGGFVGLASYRYEGGRVLGRRLYRDGVNWLEEARTLNVSGLLTGISVNSGAILEEEIVRDGRGHVERVRSPRPETVPGNPAEQAVGDAYLLDGFDRLVEAKLGIKGSDWSTPYAQITAWGDRKVAHALDKAQNRTGVTSWDVQGTPTATVYQPEAASNRYASVGGVAQVHDGNGNLVWDGERYYVYDYLDRLCEVWVPESQEARSWAAKGLTATDVNLLGTSLAKGVDLKKAVAPGTAMRSSTEVLGWVLVGMYGYDPHGRRVLRAEGSAAFATSWDGWERAEEYQDPTGEGAVWNPVRVFFTGSGVDEHLGYARKENSVWVRYTLVTGHLGHVRAVVDGGGNVVERYVYDLYGERKIYSGAWVPRSVSAVGNDSGYTGRTHDNATGLVYYRLRYMNPRDGRFLTLDPIGIWGDSGNWGNGYGYVGNRPNVAADPYGDIVVLSSAFMADPEAMRSLAELCKTDEGQTLFNKLNDSSEIFFIDTNNKMEDAGNFTPPEWLCRAFDPVALPGGGSRNAARIMLRTREVPGEWMTSCWRRAFGIFHEFLHAEDWLEIVVNGKPPASITPGSKSCFKSPLKQENFRVEFTEHFLFGDGILSVEGYEKWLNYFLKNKSLRKALKREYMSMHRDLCDQRQDLGRDVEGSPFSVEELNEELEGIRSGQSTDLHHSIRNQLERKR